MLRSPIPVNNNTTIFIPAEQRLPNFFFFFLSLETQKEKFCVSPRPKVEKTHHALSKISGSFGSFVHC